MPAKPIKRPDLGGPFPEHIAIIMDGNGRWAQARGMVRVQGHRAGVKSVREVTTECAQMGVKSLTLYAFSAENWKRPAREVSYLMRLLRVFMHRERLTLMDNDVRLRCIGRIDQLPLQAQRELQRVPKPCWYPQITYVQRQCRDALRGRNPLLRNYPQ